MNYSKACDDLKNVIEILEINIQHYHKNNKSAYRTVAAQLRLLLCDKDSSLLPRVFKNPKLHPLRLQGIDENTVLFLPSVTYFDGKGGSKSEGSLFDAKKTPIELNDWLDQKLFNKNISIRELIKSIADKEAVHSDPDYNQTLKFSRSVKLVGEAIHQKYVIQIGEYILNELKKSMPKNK